MKVGGSGSDSTPAPGQPAGGLDWFDIDSFLDDYVNDLGNSDPLADINLDFSLPFPPAGGAVQSPALKVEHVHAIPPAPVVAAPPPAPAQQPQMVPSDSDHASELEEPRTKKTRGAATRSKRSAASVDVDYGETNSERRKHLALQEKNRRAQRRFRERQKQRVAELEEQVAELTAQLSETLRERDALRSGELQAANSLCTMGPGSGGDGANGGAQRQGTDPLHASEACSDAQAGAASHVCLTLTLKAGMPEVALTPADLAAMPAGTLSSHFCTLVKELAKTVVDAAGTSEGEERVRQLIEQALALWSCAGQHNPSAMKQFLTTKLDEGHKGGPADERTPQIVRVLGLSDLQKKELCNLRRLFVQRMAAIANGRSSMASPVIGAPAVCGTSGRAMASQQLAARQAARHVTNALHEEHTTALEFENAVTRHVLAPAQVAQLLIQSYPWPPDCLSVATWVAAESGDAEALAALASEAQARNAAAAAAASGKVLPTDASFSAFVTPFLNGGMVPVGIGLQGGCTSSANTAVGGPVPLF